MLMYHTRCFHSSAAWCLFLFYNCKNVRLIRCYQPLVVPKIIGREEKGQRRKWRLEDTVSHHPSSFYILSFLSPCFPKQSHLQLGPSSSCHLSVADTVWSLFHSTAPVHLPVWLAGSLTQAGVTPPSEICGIHPAIHRKEQKPEWKHRSKRHPVIYTWGKDADVVLSRFCCVSSCERSRVWRQPDTTVYKNSVIHLWPYAASYVLSGVTDAAENHLELLRICCRYLLKMPTRTQTMHKIPLDIHCSCWENAKTSEGWLPPASWV